MNIKRTIKERKFIEAYIENCGNATKAYMAINPEYKGENARILACQLLTKLNISNNELMEMMGITDGYLHEKLDQGLNATKTISVIPIPPKACQPSSGDLPKANSKNVEYVDVDDFAVRHRYLDTAYKLKGKYPPTTVKNELTGADGSPLTFIIEKTYEQNKKEGGK